LGFKDIMEYFLGIDIGTTSVKTIAFSREGKAIAEQSKTYPIRHPFPDWSEQDPEEIWQAFVQTVESILQELAPHMPLLCSFCSAMHSLIAVDSQGTALTPSIIWADNRSAAFAEKIHTENKASALYQRTGLPVHAMSPFCKLLWLKKNQPDCFDRACKFVGIKEYVFYKLFGVWVVDASLAAATGLMDRDTRQWDPWILEQIGIFPEKLSVIVEIDKSFYSPDFFPTLKNIPFFIGGSDGAMANLGATDEPGTLVVTVGTSSAARLIVSEPHLDPGMRSFCYYLRHGSWLLGGASNNGGIILQWLQEDFFRSKENVPDFLEQAATVKPGAEGLIFIPYLLGERSPIWNAHARGVLFGLQIRHGQAEMVRATLEAVIYCLLGISQPLFEQAEIRKIYATGGFARNELWLQILADTFNLPVSICETVENSAWGAAKCGMQAMGIPVSGNSAVSKTFYPDAMVHPVYANGFSRFQRLYALLKEEFR
jgi:gluconokinase